MPAPTPPPTSLIEDAAGGIAATARSLLKHWPTVVACVLAGGGLALGYSKVSPKIYQAATTLEIAPKASQPLDKDFGNPVGAPSYWDTREYYETQYKILLSDHMLGLVVHDLSLRSDPAYGGPATSAGPLPEERIVADRLRGQITVDPVRSTRLVQLRVEDTNPERAQRIANAMATEFVDQNLQNAIAANAQSVEWLNTQADHVKQDLDQNENALHKFKEDNQLPSPSVNESTNNFRVEMEAFDQALTQTRTKKQEVLARQAGLASMLASENPAQIAVSELLNNGFLSGLRSQYLEAVKEHDSLLAEGKGENHPLVKRSAERMAQVKGALLSEVQNIKGAVDHDLAVLNRQEAGLASLFEASRRNAIDLNMKEIEYHRLDRARVENEKLFELLFSRMKEADIGRMMRVNNIRVIDSAATPRAPIRPRTLINVGIGLLVGVILGLAMAIGREQLDNSLKTPDDLECKLGITFLGLVPELAEGEGGTPRRRTSAAGASRIAPSHSSLSSTNSPTAASPRRPAASAPT